MEVAGLLILILHAEMMIDAETMIAAEEKGRGRGNLFEQGEESMLRLIADILQKGGIILLMGMHHRIHVLQFNKGVVLLGKGKTFFFRPGYIAGEAGGLESFQLGFSIGRWKSQDIALLHKTKGQGLDYIFLYELP